MAIAGLGCPLAAMASSASTDASTPSMRIYGGEPVKTCEWPTTIGLGYCTATLVHPRVALTAAHCGSPKKLYFGEKYDGGISKTVETKYCVKNRRSEAYAGRGGDSQYCVLAEPVEGIPIAPIVYGCEIEQVKAGADIWLVGFGENDAYRKGSGVKHKVQVKINKVLGDQVELIVGGDGKATCYGDSGGPAYLKMSDGTWRTVGITSYGTSKQCGYPSGLTTASSAVKWIQKSLNERNEDIDLQPCYDDDGKWEPTAKCGGFALEPGTAFGTWEELCSEDAPRSGMSEICGPAAEGGDFPKGKGKPKLSWGEGMAKAPSIMQDESLSIDVTFKGSKSAVDHLAVLLDDDVVAQGSLKSPPVLKDLDPGSYQLQVQARDEDDEVLAQTKALKLTVKEASEDKSNTPDPSPGDTSGSPEPGTPEPTPSQDDASGDASDSQDSDKDQGQDEQAAPEGCGCHAAPGSGAMGGAFAFLSLFAWRRRGAKRSGMCDSASRAT